MAIVVSVFEKAAVDSIFLDQKRAAFVQAEKAYHKFRNDPTGDSIPLAAAERLKNLFEIYLEARQEYADNQATFNTEYQEIIVFLQDIQPRSVTGDIDYDMADFHAHGHYTFSLEGENLVVKKQVE